MIVTHMITWGTITQRFGHAVYICDIMSSSVVREFPQLDGEILPRLIRIAPCGARNPGQAQGIRQVFTVMQGYKLTRTVPLGINGIHVA